MSCAIKDVPSHMSRKLSLRLIGAFQLILQPGPRLVNVKTKKARALLAYLAMQQDLSAPRTVLANMFWPDCTDGNARHSLRQCLVSLRKELHAFSPDLLQVSGETIALDAQLIEADACRLLQVDINAERYELAAVLTSVRGDFLSGLEINDTFSSWASDLRRRIVQKLEEILLAIVEQPLNDDVTAKAVAAARTLAECDPFCENCRRLLIGLTARVHGPDRALAEYRAFVEFLRREGLGEPDARTLDLIYQIEQLPLRRTTQLAPPRVLKIEDASSGNLSDQDRSVPHRPTVAPDRGGVQPGAPDLASKRRAGNFRWTETVLRLAAATALIMALPPVLQGVDRFIHVDKAEATSVSALLANAQDDPTFRAIPIAIRQFGGLANDDPLAEQLRDMISHTVSLIPELKMLSRSDSEFAPYVLDGKIATELGSQTLTVELSRSSGELLWRESFKLSEKPSPLGKIAQRITREIELALIRAESRSAIARSDASLKSLLLTARNVHTRGVSSNSELDGLKLYEKALALDDDSAQALVGVSAQILTSQSHSLRADADLQKRAEAYLRTAISIDPNMFLAHFHMGMLHKNRGQAGQAIASFSRALQLNPSFAPAYANLGHALMMQGKPDEALNNVRHAMQISPNDGFFASWSVFAGEIELERGNTGAAIDWFRTAIARGPHLLRPYGWIAGAYEIAGDSASSAENIRQFRAMIGEREADSLMERLRKVPEGGLAGTRPTLYRAIKLAAQRHQ